MAYFNLRFDDYFILPVESHKHLGVTFASNAKWSQHIDNIYQTTLKEINGLRKLKYLLSRSALNRKYCTFILPLLEYACEIWGGCSNIKKRLLLGCIHHFKSDPINNMDHLRSWGTEPLSVILSQTE